jgi:hypothetical protein
MTSASMDYFLLLNAEEQREAIHRLARSGMGDYSIASATRLSVEQIRKIIAEKNSEAGE